QPGPDRGAVGVPRAVLVTGPVAGEALGARVAGAGEGDAVVPRHRLHELVVGAHVEVRVGVEELEAATAVVGAQVTAPEVLAAVGLHAVDAELLEEVAALGEPPLARR